MARVVRGDVDAFAQVYDAHAPTVAAVLQRVLRHHSDAQDLLHDVFLEAWQQARDYDSTRASVRVWLLVRARARALDRVRRRARERNVRSLLGRGKTLPIVDERQFAVRQALGMLEKNVREALELTYYEGMAASEIAARLRIPEGTVRSRLARGMARMQDMFGKLEGSW